MLKIEVHGDKARLYVQGAPQPALVVNDLKQAQGKIALWIGTETIAHFANLRVSVRIRGEIDIVSDGRRS